MLSYLIAASDLTAVSGLKAVSDLKEIADLKAVSDLKVIADLKAYLTLSRGSREIVSKFITTYPKGFGGENGWCDEEQLRAMWKATALEAKAWPREGKGR